ncbi:MAG: hypothetical protein JWN03_7065 [Nocardia sp.]|uniref:hypothetical protein n=1 Tax=Nocardia sp. TaxID=1821 RepID=UPI0026360838|nr:hypothetical protein [Nocardia sp.]MCU1646790.1 hypothetical protein [Nocardia sp.]
MSLSQLDVVNESDELPGLAWLDVFGTDDAAVLSAPDLMVQVGDFGDGDITVTAGAKLPSALRSLAHLGIDWDDYDG